MKGAIIFCSMMILSSCAPTKELHRPLLNRSAEEVIEAVNAYRSTISTFEGKGSISVESPSFANSASFELWLKKPDSARVDIEGPFGIRVASALFAGNNYVFYNSFKNEVMTGDLRSEDLPMVMNIRIKPEDLIDTFSGARSFLSGETHPDSFIIGDGAYTLFFRHENSATRYAVDGRTLRITRVDHLDSTGAVWSEEQFDFDRRDDGTPVPQSIRLNYEGRQSSLSLYYDIVRVNDPVAPMTLSVPADARRVTKQ